MADLPSIVLILAEDQEQQNLVWYYLKNCAAFRKRMGRVRKVALPGNRGCGSQYVRERFPSEVAECRRRQASNVLIVVTDADDLLVAERERSLLSELALKSGAAISPDEPIVILIPKWQVETWVKCLLGQVVAEDDRDTDNPPVSAEQVATASDTLFGWTRPNAQVGPTCVRSLRVALPRWQRIG